MSVSVVGVDLFKSVFQLSVADAKHRVVDRKRLSRAQFHRFLAQNEPVRLVMEACGTSHYWARTGLSLRPAEKMRAWCSRVIDDLRSWYGYPNSCAVISELWSACRCHCPRAALYPWGRWRQ